jgi:prevent-host-death family protein
MAEQKLKQTRLDVDEAKEAWRSLLYGVTYSHERVIIVDDGLPVAAVISADDLERLQGFERECERDFEVLDRMAEAFQAIPFEEIESEAARALAEVRSEGCAEHDETYPTSWEWPERSWSRGVTVDARLLIVAPLSVVMPPRLIISGWITGHFHIVISKSIFDQVVRVHANQCFRDRLRDTDIEYFHGLLRLRARFVAIAESMTSIATHSEDNIALATASAAKVKYLVTSNERLSSWLSEYRDFRVISPAQYVGLLGLKP